MTFDTHPPPPVDRAGDALLDRIAVGVYATTPGGQLLYASDAFARIAGEHPERLRTLNIRGWYGDELSRARFVSLLRGERAEAQIEFALRRPDGTTRWVLDTATAVRDSSGTIARVEGAWQDVTEERQARMALLSSESRLRLLVGQVPAILWSADVELRYTSAQGGGLNTLGMHAADIVGLRMIDLFNIKDPASEQLSACKAALAGSSASYESVLQGNIFKTAVEPHRNESGEIVGIVGASVNVTEQRRAAQALERNKTELAVAQRAAHVGSWECDLSTGWSMCSEELLRIYGLPSTEALVHVRSIVALQHPDDADRMREAMASAKASRTSYTLDHRIVRPDGELRWLQERGEYRYDASGEATWAIGTCFDITERKRAEEHLAYLAHHDALTGLPNRVLFSERLRVALEAAGTSWTGVLFVDVDRFKYINDTLGHAMGDAFLRTVAERLRSVVPGENVARWGGDEFVVFIPGGESDAQIQPAAEAILAAFAAPICIDGSELYTSISIGIAYAPHDGTTPDQLIRCADTAMYKAKESGRNTYRVFTSGMHDSSAARLRLENDLRVALRRDEFVLHYQPIVETNGKVAAVEALVRWQHPENGMIPPDHFIPIAEETGLIVPLGEWVMRTACRQLRTWDELGLPPIRMALNISGRQFQHSGLARTVRRVLDETGVAAARLELEITETVVMQDVETTIRSLDELKAIGVRVSVDDFGTGYSSLSYLKRFPIDTLKIDRTFTRDTPDDREDSAIVEAVIALAHTLGLRVIAEGVETPAQQSFLATLACDELQGYLFSRPLPAGAIAERIRPPSASSPAALRGERTA